MPSPPSTPDSLTLMAEEIFALTVLSWRHRIATKHASSSDELSESQFLTLDGLIHAPGTLTVGELQRGIGVLPAQMSRIIRSLESGFAKPLIHCDLNPADKRKIDVALTPDGRTMYDDFRAGRVNKTADILHHLTDADRHEFIRICRKLREYHGAALKASQAVANG